MIKEDYLWTPGEYYQLRLAFKSTLAVWIKYLPFRIHIEITLADEKNMVVGKVYETNHYLTSIAQDVSSTNHL